MELNKIEKEAVKAIDECQKKVVFLATLNLIKTKHYKVHESNPDLSDGIPLSEIAAETDRLFSLNKQLREVK